jgi:hypothetical protein
MDRFGPDALERLLKLLGMLGSAFDGERAAAGLKAHEFIKRHALQWTDIIVVTPPKIGWREKVRACEAHLHLLSDKERAFLRTMLARYPH